MAEQTRDHEIDSVLKNSNFMRSFLSFSFLLLSLHCISQQTTTFWTKSDTLNKPRRNALIIGESVLAGGTLLALDQAWYADYPRTGFQFTNDNNQWLQMDKVGHVMSSYYIGKVGMELLDWSGVSKKNQILYN